MKRLVEYFNELNPTQEPIVSNLEDNDMKALKIVAPQNEIDEALWNSKEDKWSRNAKHHITATDLEVPSHTWEKGELAIYEGQEVKIVIGQGTKSVVGISLNGRTKMVKGHTLSPLTEGVLGGLTQLSPINRIMQLAGLSSGVAEGEIAEEPKAISEDDSTNMFTQLFRANLAGEYRNNPSAARVATIGQILAGLSDQTSNLQGISQDIMTKISAAIGLGSALMQLAKSMTQEPTT